MILIDGKKISREILVEVKNEISKLSFAPVFCDILVGDDIVSKQYVHLKKKKAKEAGIHFHEAFFPESVTTREVVEEIQKINKMPNMCGIIIQLPLPPQLDMHTILDAIDPELDVDCLGNVASRSFYKGGDGISFPTALACMRMLDEIGESFEYKNIVVLGQGKLVGKPVSALLKKKGLEHTCLDKESENKIEILQNADLIISGIGQERYIKGDMIKDGVSIIDAGTSESSGSVAGDVDFDSVKDKVRYLTPVPGGVGPVTVAMLFKNVLKVAQTKARIKNE